MGSENESEFNNILVCSSLHNNERYEEFDPKVDISNERN